MKISVKCGNGRIVARESLDGCGVVVSYPDEFERRIRRDYYDYRGGSWELRFDGTRGRQLTGTLDVRVPRDGRRLRRFLERLAQGD
jgi:hypothetical protein